MDYLGEKNTTQITDKTLVLYLMKKCVGRNSLKEKFLFLVEAEWQFILRKKEADIIHYICVVF